MQAKITRYFSNKRIWVTGASSGIGKTLSIQLAQYGAKLILSGRDRQRLDHVAKTCGSAVVATIRFDITDRKATLEAAAQIQQQAGGLDIAIFNAGASEYFEIQQFDSRVFEKMIAVNYFSLVYGVEACLPLLRQSQYPHLVGMSSIASYTGLPLGTPYCAAKAAARNFLQGIRCSLVAEKIPVTTLCPGFIDTPLTQVHDFQMPFIMSAEKAAQRIIKAISCQTQEYHFPKRMSLLMKLVSSLPNRWMTYWVSRVVLR